MKSNEEYSKQFFSDLNTAFILLLKMANNGISKLICEKMY